MKYITFDPYYPLSIINQFIESYRNKYGKHSLRNKIGISTISPYNWFIRVDNQKNLPIWINYKVASTNEIKNMVHTVIPLLAVEEYRLMRRPGDLPNNFSRFITPECFKGFNNQKYAVIFRMTSDEDLKVISKEIGTTIWKLGKHRGNWKLCLCYDKGIKNYLSQNQIIQEKLSKSDFSSPGSFEVALNLKLVSDKLHNKVMQYPYWKNGNYTIAPKTL